MTGGKGTEGKTFRYCVLYVHRAGQDRLKAAIEKHFPKGHGEVFIPRMELYRRGDREVRETPVFPGYVFLYTNLNMEETHRMLGKCRPELGVAFRELALEERRAGGQDYPEGESDDVCVCGLSDINEEETKFLEMLRESDGLLGMSFGYQEGGRYYVAEGPLKAYENQIEKVDKHNRKAFLKFEINGRQARAGFECKPKAHWFPDENVRMAVLADGAEVDLEELKRKVMKI